MRKGLEALLRDWCKDEIGNDSLMDGLEDDGERIYRVVDYINEGALEGGSFTLRRLNKLADLLRDHYDSHLRQGGRSFWRLRSEFPGYPVEELPTIPDGWEDSSDGRFSCPSFAAGRTGKDSYSLVEVSIDWPKEGHRARKGYPRFMVLVEGVREYDSDNWDDILRRVDLLLT